MARIKQPQLPEGALNDFFAALHDLHLKAGFPSTRDIQRDIGREFVSHTTIHKAFSGPRLPGWTIVEQLVEALAQRSRQDSETVTRNLHSLWQNAARSLGSSSGGDVDRVRSATQVVRDTIDERAAHPFADLLLGTLDEIEAAGTREVNRELVPTGFADVDQLTGGMRAGSLIAIASRPSIGKSMLLGSICMTSALKYGLPTAIYSSEMTEREIQMRILSAKARVSHHSLRSGMMGEEDWRRVAQRMGEIADAPLWLFHSANPDLTSLEDETKALSDAYGLRLIAIDNVDALMNGNTGPEETLYRLKQLAADLGVPILVTATMKTHADARTHGRPDMNDLTNSDPIGAIVDILILLDRPDAYDVESSRAGEIDLIFAKNRYGPIATATLAFQGYYCRMLDLFVSSDPGRDWSFKGLKSTAANPPKKDDS